MDMEYADKLTAAMGELNEMKVLSFVLDLTEQGVPTREIRESLQAGIRQVDERYAAGEYFLADLIMASHILRSARNTALNLREPEAPPCPGRVLICTVQGERSDLARQAAVEVLRHNDFLVTDLGADAAPDAVSAAIRAHRPDILVLSASQSTSVRSMRGTIRTVEAGGLRKGLRILVYGNSVKDFSARVLGADGKCATVLDCLRLCRGEEEGQ